MDPSHEKPCWPLVQTEFVSQWCSSPAHTHTLCPAGALLHGCLVGFLLLLAEGRGSGITLVIVEDLYMCLQQMLGFRGLSSV